MAPCTKGDDQNRWINYEMHNIWWFFIPVSKNHVTSVCINFKIFAETPRYILHNEVLKLGFKPNVFQVYGDTR